MEAGRYSAAEAVRATFDDPFGVFPDGPGGKPRRGRRRNGRNGRHAPDGTDADGPHRAALAAFGLSLPVTVVEVKRRYKQLVKRHHPDHNGGAKAAEEKIKEINAAYHTLMRFMAS